MAMSHASARLRSRPEWWLEHRNKQSKQKWKAELLRSPLTIRTPCGSETIRLSLKQLITCTDGKFSLGTSTGAHSVSFILSQVSCFERIWESEDVLSFNEILDLERDVIQSLPHAPNHNGVVHVIDPFLNALIFEKTPVYDIHQPGLLRRQPAPSYMRDYSVSKEFAFLPTDFSISTAGHVKALSYINNLHPGETKAMQGLENLLERCLPLFSHVLTDLHRNNPLYQRIKGSCRYTEWDEPEPPDHSDDEEGWVAYERDVRLWIMKRPIELPDVPSGGYKGGLESRRHTVELLGRNLQFVVHSYEICLVRWISLPFTFQSAEIFSRKSPDNCTYDGTPWHVVGMMNEKIVACLFFYASAVRRPLADISSFTEVLMQENITDGVIEFRMAVTSPSGFEPGDTGATSRTWAMKDGDPCHQYVGSRRITPGLCIAFPNLYQHRQSALKLVDPAKCGHQRVIALYMVDPDVNPVISTSRVPPQQKSWVKAATEEFIDKRLPVEVVEQIVDEVDGKMTYIEAEHYRERMLSERENFRKMNDLYHFCVPFDIWSSNSLH
ncbi:hypothetical protein HWV62_28668 [Athelia sp. TMB]|nr:hypothetical protein HWV62_28668 [Athelia sp. TMB]